MKKSNLAVLLAFITLSAAGMAHAESEQRTCKIQLPENGINDPQLGQVIIMGDLKIKITKRYTHGGFSGRWNTANPNRETGSNAIPFESLEISIKAPKIEIDRNKFNWFGADVKPDGDGQILDSIGLAPSLPVTGPMQVKICGVMHYFSWGGMNTNIPGTNKLTITSEAGW